MKIIKELNLIFSQMITWVVKLAPVAVVFLISGALAGTSDFGAFFKDAGLLIVTVVCGLLTHGLVTLPAFFFLVTGENPYHYLSFMTDTFAFVFGAQSSAAALPVTMRCVKATKLVPKNIRTFVISLGTTMNMDGSALYFPVAIIFMAYVSGYCYSHISS